MHDRQLGVLKAEDKAMQNMINTRNMREKLL